MFLGGCQGKPDPHKVIEKICPQCGNIIEMFPVDGKMACDNCGYIAYNDTVSCVRWCSSAKTCMGEALYNAVMEQVEREKK